jgi:Endonuclease-reverse transcriptase
VIGDFNLHHPLWGGLASPSQHAAADLLLDIARNHSLELATPQGTITWRSRGLTSTIDLAFVSENLSHNIVKCRPRNDIAQSSDHVPIELTINIHTQPFAPERKRCWKKLDPEKLQTLLQEASVPHSILENNTQIDTRIIEVTRAVTKAIEDSVPWATPSKQAKDFWSSECVEMVKRTRTLFYEKLRTGTRSSKQRHKEARKEKVRVIRKHRQKQFRKQIAKSTNLAIGAWKLAKWARNRSQIPRQPPQLPQLIVKSKDSHGQEIRQEANTLTEKFAALKSQFFPSLPNTDISDIDFFTYPEPIEFDPLITDVDIATSLRWVSNDKAPGPDEIPNRILKTVPDWFIYKLNPIFNASIYNRYHPVV